jgi:hypothetical protein
MNLLNEAGECVGHMLITPMEEVRREWDGKDVRWCFGCRSRQLFEYVVTAPICITGEEAGCWYEPTHSIECSNCLLEDGDLFPGRMRCWDEGGCEE